MLLSVVAWEDGARAACESKVRTSIYMKGHCTMDVAGKAFCIPSAVYDRAVDAVKWALYGLDDACTKDGFGFTSLLPAYALADAADSFEKKGGDPRLIMLQSLWDQVAPIDLTIVVRRNTDDDTLVDAAKDLSKRCIIVTPKEVWSSNFGNEIAERVIAFLPKRRTRKPAVKKVTKKKTTKKKKAKR